MRPTTTTRLVVVATALQVAGSHENGEASQYGHLEIGRYELPDGGIELRRTMTMTGAGNAMTRNNS